MSGHAVRFFFSLAAEFSCNLFLSSKCSWRQAVLSMICGFWLNISSVKCFSGVLEEAEFYNITSLIKLVKDKIRERDCKTAQVSQVEIVLLHISNKTNQSVFSFISCNCEFISQFWEKIVNCGI